MAKKQSQPTVRHYCRECANATDFHERNWKGEFFMCKCKFQKRSMFLNHDCCENFKMK